MQPNQVCYTSQILGNECTLILNQNEDTKCNEGNKKNLIFTDERQELTMS